MRCSSTQRSAAASTIRGIPLAITGFFVSACIDTVAPPTPGPLAPAYSDRHGAVDHVVFPTGVFPADVASVQLALERGGTVLLKATNNAGVPTAFNFGPPVSGSGFVVLRTDVTLLGETLVDGMTTIAGGNAPIRASTMVSAAIHGISFDGPRVAAALVTATTGFEITNSQVRDVVPFLFFSDPDYGDVYKAQAVWVTGTSTSLTGTIVIEDNLFENCGLRGAIDGYGLALVPGGASVRVARNTIRGANLAGVIVIQPSQQVLIENNLIVPGPGDIQPRFWGNGIHLLGSSRTPSGFVAVRNNDIIVEGSEAHGVFAFGDADFLGSVRKPVIEGNRITVRGGWTGVGLWGSASNGLVRNNQIRGSAEFALLIGEGFFHPTDEAVSNVMIGNNIAVFDASTAEVLFDSNTVSNALAGHSGTVIDLGRGNRITGTLTSVPKQLGNLIRSAHLSNRVQSASSPPDLK